MRITFGGDLDDGKILRAVIFRSNKLVRIGHNSGNTNSIALPNVLRNKYVVKREIITTFIKALGSFDGKDRSDAVRDIDAMSDENIERLGEFLSNCVSVMASTDWSDKLRAHFESRPTKYKDAPAPKNPVDHLEAKWGKFMDRGVLFQDQLFKYDRSLIPSVHAYWSEYGRKEGQRLPLPKERRTDAVIEALTLISPFSVEEIARAANAYHQREARTRRRGHRPPNP